ncbi:MAG: hypothetical protein ACFFAZ_15955, partial [Promethearchaeota archaeon]
MKTGTLRIFFFSGTPRDLVTNLLDVHREWFKRYFVDATFQSEELPLPEGAFVAGRRQYKARPFLEMLGSHT